MARLLGELLEREPDVVELKVDSKSALTLARNPVFHERSKHIDLRYHFIRNCLAEGAVSTTYINTVDQLTCILMKALVRVKFQELRARIGMVQIGRDRDQGEIDRDNPCRDLIDRLTVELIDKLIVRDHARSLPVQLCQQTSQMLATFSHHL
jgi:hypothetical protein